MVCGVEMFGGMLVLGGIAAAHMPALEAQAQVYPSISNFQTILTTIRAGRDVAYFVEMRTLYCHENLLFYFVFALLLPFLPSISNRALRALARAKPEPISM